MTITIILIVIAAVLLLSIVGGFIFTMHIAHGVFEQHLKRPSRQDWARGVCGFPDNAENLAMFHEGMDWYEKNADCVHEVSTVSEGLKLCGQYFDFGFDRAVLLLAGRAESLTYSYYFAIPYREIGYNVLVIDNRATGLSEGEYNCTGLREYRDVMAWIKLLRTDLHNKFVLLHGVCIGASAAVMAAADKACPDGVQGIVADGMFTTFAETFRTHMIELKRPVFPVCMECMLYLWSKAGRNPYRHGPLYSLKDVHVPILMLHGRQDRFSLPEKAELLFGLCNEPKKLVWFEKGSHSHLRCNAPEQYDKAIFDFVGEQFS